MERAFAWFRHFMRLAGRCERKAEIHSAFLELAACPLVNFGKARIQVRRLGMTKGAFAGEVELEVKDVQ